MKKFKYILVALIGFLSLTNCQDEDQEFGEIITPTNVTVVAEIVGQDADNPYGDGSGFVNFVATADNEITFQYNYGDGRSEVSPTGEIMHRFTNTGVNTYTVIVNAVGTGGVLSSATINVEVFSAFDDVEAKSFLTGAPIIEDNEGNPSLGIDPGAQFSKTWYWAADKALHVGLGPVEDDYGNGEFSYEAWWSGIQPFDSEKSCMYQNEFVFTASENGINFEQVVGPAFVPGAYADVIGVGGDQCHDETVATNMFGLKSVSFFPSDSKAALEGSYAEMPYRQTTFDISDGGFMGWFVGSGTYDIISISDTEMQVRIIQAGGGFAWYHKFQTQNPYETDNFPDLIWSDEFDTDGAPDATNWTYDLGAGGWGNGEAQTYTNNAENVIVENGSLKIIAKNDGSGYTSARLKTQGLFDFKYGKVEVRAKLPEAQGTWPAIWMLGSNFPTVGWPQSGEIDIMEQTGSNKNEILATTHWYDTVNSQTASFNQTTAISNASSEFHVYKLEWTEESIKIFVDDMQYYNFSNNSDLPFDEDFFMILNIAMGGTLGGTIDPGFSEDVMEIDYVRVYQ